MTGSSVCSGKKSQFSHMTARGQNKAGLTWLDDFLRLRICFGWNDELLTK
jgi:hypothetical protein